ncbi:hypothetical protein SCYAM73S_03568 [Streptomyces cyaneofuscatus]
MDAPTATTADTDVMDTPQEDPTVHILWINAGLSCDGDSVSLTAATQPSIEELALGALPGLPKVAVHWPLIDYECGPVQGADNFALDTGGGPIARLWSTALSGLVDIGYIKATGHSVRINLPRTMTKPEMSLEWTIPQWSNAIERNRARTYSQAYAAAAALHFAEQAMEEVRAGRTQTWEQFDVPDESIGVGFTEAVRGPSPSPTPSPTPAPSSASTPCTSPTRASSSPSYPPTTPTPSWRRCAPTRSARSRYGSGPASRTTPAWSWPPPASAEPGWWTCPSVSNCRGSADTAPGRGREPDAVSNNPPWKVRLA